ncbi:MULTISPECIES: metallophosphoesterase [unclassified Frondihabitans]|uniref:metallophosphoesterase n=1 Tax=unclassified Frondihabitans TaxID=2626248 RepID=UPI000F4FC728|nr:MULTISPECIES: metallophosphoesterase [unclassified Frondihabitans]RPE77871.1 calcineurin-like phosphoesterase family protein [Frondihabitans sp. PhB153]RPF08150.1 calcineurin-like phosphoesterase family protein [Frondihabitans sp. PhB161]
MFHLDDETHVLIAGDWHSNLSWLLNVIPRARSASPTARTLLQLGDFNIGAGRHAKAFVNMADSLCRGQGIERLLITPGNHDHWGRLENIEGWHEGRPAQISERIWVLPRGYRFAIGGRTFMSFGGAASLDRHDRVEGETWWPSEVGSDLEFSSAAAAGRADVMLTHEAVDGATSATDSITAGHNPYHWPGDRLEASAESRRRTTHLWNVVHPAILFHGHLHAGATGALNDGRRVYSLDMDARRGNLGVLDLETLSWVWH